MASLELETEAAVTTEGAVNDDAEAVEASASTSRDSDEQEKAKDNKGIVKDKKETAKDKKERAKEKREKAKEKKEKAAKEKKEKAKGKEEKAKEKKERAKELKEKAKEKKKKEKEKEKTKTKGGAKDAVAGEGVGEGDDVESGDEPRPSEGVTMDAGEIDGTADIPEEYRDADGNFKMMPVPRQLGSLTRRRPPLVVIMGVAGAGKSRLGAALLGSKEDYRAVFRVGSKTTVPKVVVGEHLTVVDTPGLPDPFPQSSDAYYNDTVKKLRQVGYAHALVFVLNQERVTPTLIKNYGILYRAMNKLPCVKMFVCRRESSFLAQNIADQAVHEAETRSIVNGILEATNLKKWKTKQFFMWTNGSGEEQDKQVKYVREQVKVSPRVEIVPGEGLLLTTEAAAAAAQKAEALAKAAEEATGGKSRKKSKKASSGASAAAAASASASSSASASASAAVSSDDEGGVPGSSDGKKSGCSIM